MRKAYNNVSIVRDENNQFIGVSLGYDFCAEHEWGIKGIKRKFGIDDSKIGIEGRSISKSHVVYKEKGNLALIRSHSDYDNLDDKSFKECLPYAFDIREDNEVNTAWNESDFCIIAEKSLIKEIYDAFNEMNICFASISDMPAFGGTSLCVLIKNRVPKEASDNMTYVDQKDIDLGIYEKKIGITKLKEKKYCSKYSNDYNKDKHKYWMALSPRWINYKNESPEQKEKNKT